MMKTKEERLEQALDFICGWSDMPGHQWDAKFYGKLEGYDPSAGGNLRRKHEKLAEIARKIANGEMVING